MLAQRIDDPSHVNEARRRFAGLAAKASLSEEDAGRVALVITELATNLLKHAGGGELVGEVMADSLLRIQAIDKGPGMADVTRCLQDGYSTAGSSGTGFGAINRLSERMSVHSRPGSGTIIEARFGSAAKARGSEIEIAAVCLPKLGEELCGDAWSRKDLPGGVHAIMVADGLGHGFFASEAARLAVKLFDDMADRQPETILQALHEGLRPTRGAAIAVARLDLPRRRLAYAGLGNIAALLAAGGKSQRLVSNNGTVGHTARTIRQFEYGWEGNPTLVMHSDGLGSSWSLENYPGWQSLGPSMLAALLYRDFCKQRDDVTVLVAGQPA